MVLRLLAAGGSSLQGLLVAGASFVAEHGLYGTQAQELWHTELVAPLHVGAS